MSISGDAQNVNINGGNLIVTGSSNKVRTPNLQFGDGTTMTTAPSLDVVVSTFGNTTSNIVTVGGLTATGNVAAAGYFKGDGSLLTGVITSSNLAQVVANGNVTTGTISIGGLTVGSNLVVNDTASNVLYVRGGIQNLALQSNGVIYVGAGNVLTTNLASLSFDPVTHILHVDETGGLDARVVTPGLFPQTTVKGQPVYLQENVGGVRHMHLADNDVAGLYPAIGLTLYDYATNDNGYVVTNGSLLDLSIPATFVEGSLVSGSGGDVGKTVYLSATPGFMTITRPTLASNAVQTLGIIAQVTGNKVDILVRCLGRVEDTPNAIVAQTANIWGSVSIGDGTLKSSTNLHVTGNVYLAGVSGAANTLTVNGNVSANYYAGNASLLSWTTSATPGTYGSSIAVPSITIDANGRVSTVSSTTFNQVATGTLNQVAYYSASNTVSGDSGLTYNTSTDTLTVGGGLVLGGDLTVAGNTYSSNNIVFNDAVVLIANSVPANTTRGMLMQRPGGNVMAAYLSTESASAYMNTFVFGYTFGGAAGPLLTPDLSNTLNVAVLGSLTSTTGLYGNVLGSNTGSFSNISISSNIIGLGPGAGASSAANTIAIGPSAGNSGQSSYAISIGNFAGNLGQNAFSIAMGDGAGRTGQYTSAVAIGRAAGSTNQEQNAIAVGIFAASIQQGNNSVAIGNAAGNDTQGSFSIGIGYFAGSASQNTNSIAIGYQAGQLGQYSNAVAIGYLAGQTNQRFDSVAIGANAGNSGQLQYSVAIGSNVGQTGQQTQTVAIGYQAGQTNQAFNAVAIGSNAANSGQLQYAVAIGSSAGNATQGTQAVAIGTSAGTTSQGTGSIAIGGSAGSASQNTNSIAIGYLAGQSFQNAFSVALGYQAGQSSQDYNSVAIGYLAGQVTQGSQSVAMGPGAGTIDQGASAVALGQNAGRTSQGLSAIGIGGSAGSASQDSYAIALGSLSGQTSQGYAAISVGYAAAQNSQDAGAIAIGQNAGRSNQNVYSVAIGYGAAQSNQGSYSVAIGNLAGQTNQNSFSIALNALTTAFAPAASGFYVRPVRTTGTGNAVLWNGTTFEMSAPSSTYDSKSNVADLTTNTAVLYNLVPKTYYYKDGSPDWNKYFVGYMAEDAANVALSFGRYDEPGGPPTQVNYDVITIYTVEELKKRREFSGRGTVPADGSNAATITVQSAATFVDPVVHATPIFNGTRRIVNVGPWDPETTSFTVYGAAGDFYWTLKNNAP